MKSEFEANLVEALDALEAGTQVEEILSRYPDQAGQLRPILETSAQLSALPLAHSLSAQAASRDAFLERAAALREQGQQQVGTPALLWRRLVLAFASLAIFLVLASGLAVGAARESLPGQALYPVKRAVEDVRLSLASNPNRREALQAQFRAERREEIYALLADGLDGRVECRGMIEAIGDDGWTLDGLMVEVEATTTIVGTPQAGAIVQGICRVQSGRVVAERLRILAEPQPTPTPTETPTATATPSPTTTSTPTTTATPTAAPPSPALITTPVPAPPAQSGGTDEGEPEEEEEEDGEEEHDGEEEGEHEEDEDDGEESSDPAGEPGEDHSGEDDESDTVEGEPTPDDNEEEPDEPDEGGD